MGFTVAAIYYHFKAKDEILAVLAEPYLRDLDALVFEAENAAPISAQRARKVLISYLDMLLRNTTVTHFLEQDLAVQAQPLGKRLDKLTERLRISLAGSQPDASDLIRARRRSGHCADRC